MGRRPNVIVTEFFERGAKLEDSSNRYQHTCKRCGELFPKGRAENLVNHLLKACPNVSQDDRRVIAQHVQQSSKKDGNMMAAQPLPNVAHGSRVDNLPLTLERQQSALDTLAEVSRRHGDYSSMRGTSYDQNNLVNDADQTLAEQALWTQLQQHNLSIPNAQPSAEGFNFDADPSLQGLSQQAFSTADYVPSLLPTSAASTGQHTLDPQLGPVHDQSFDIAQATNPLISNNANAESQNHTVDWATELAREFPHDVLEAAVRLRNKNTQAPQLHEILETAAQIQNHQGGSNQAFDGPTQIPQHHHQDVPRSAFESVIQLDVVQHSEHDSRPKQRGRFNEARRKQVQELRKQGACLRCRMLKKPCSEGTPCKTCANIDSARLWKAKCSRSRVAEEFTAWSSGYFQAEAQLKAQAWSPSVTNTNREYVKLNFDAGQGIQLSVRSGVKIMASMTPGALLAAGGLAEYPRIEEGDDLPDKLAAYCMSDVLVRAAITNEPQQFLRTTLIESVDLLAKERAQAEEHARAETRSCYTIANSLTRDTLELWILTACLTARQTQTTSFSPMFIISDMPSMDGAGQELMQAQLLAAIESRAARLSKKVLNDLERRLLQRQQVSGFATYIAAVVLLSCVERMTSLFQALDVTDQSSWPLNVTPESLWSQGPTFAALLAMLLRMRGLPPKTFEDEQGRLAMVYEPSDKLLKINGSASEEQLRAMDEERRTALTAWLAKCNVSAAEVRSWSNSTSHDWYGRLMAMLLLQ